VPKEEGEVLGFFIPSGLNGIFLKQKCIQLMHEKLTLFLYGQYVIGNICSLAFRRNRFEIEVGIYEKFAKM